MKHRDNNIVALGGQATVNNQQVTVKYASIFHRFTGGSGKEGGGWVTDYVFVEVKLPPQCGRPPGLGTLPGRWNHKVPVQAWLARR